MDIDNFISRLPIFSGRLERIQQSLPLATTVRKRVVDRSEGIWGDVGRTEIPKRIQSPVSGLRPETSARTRYVG
jgi:hypothetical protein